MTVPGDRKLIDNADVHYGPGTRPQGPLPFFIWVRRKYRWWPGPERHGAIVDKFLLALMLSPIIGYALISFGVIPSIFVAVEIVILTEIAYRVATGTFLGH